MTNKIYYYKLISPFEEDVTKDCKLSITDIDGNFYNLKRMGIKDGYVDSENKTIILERYSGDSITIDASDIYDGIIKSSKEKNVKNIDFSFNSSANTVEVKWEDGTLESGSTSAHSFSFDSIFSPDISTDCTLIGEGNTFSPLRINPNEKTGYFKSVKSLVNIVAGQSLPVSGLSYADRYVTYERTSDYGLIYDEHAMKNISAMLESAGSVWRVPTKEDWDKLLNSLEPCMYQNHDTEGSQDKLGKYAGALLKSSDKWDESIDKGTTCTYGCECGCSANTDSLSAVTVSPEGVGYNNFDIYPAGWVDQTSHFHTSDNFGKEAGLWCNTSAETLNQWYIKIFGYNNATVAQDVVCPDAFSSIRLVKDYNGSNAIGAEEILGNSYNTAAFGKHNGVTVNQVWTLSNMMAKPDVCDNTHYYIPSGLTETVDSYNVYYLNEWNGCSWIRKKLSDGDLIVVNDASTVEAGDENDSEFIVMEDSTKTQKLVSTDTLSYDRIVEKVNNTLNSLSGMVESVSGAVNTKLSITASPWEYYGNGIRTKNASNVPIGYGSVAEGSNNISNGKYSYVNGEHNITNNEAEQAGGKYNASVSSNSVSEETFFTIGNGTSDDARSNAIEVKRNGDMYITGVGGYKYEFGEVPADAQSVQKVIHNLQEIAGTAQYLSGSTDTAVVYPNNDTKVITAKVKIAKDVPNHNIITVQQDAGLYADVRLGYDALTNKLTLYTSNLNSGYTETEIQLSSVQVFKNMYYDAASESIVMEYSPLSAQTETDQVSIPLSGLIEEWAVEEKHMGGIQLLKQRNAKDGKDLLTANAVLSDMKTNILQIDENGGMFVEGSGITDNSEKIYSLSGSVSGNSLEIKDASDKIDSLSGAMIDDELIMVKSFITVANSAGFNDNLEYVKKSGDTILSAATNLSEADTALSN